MRGDRRTVSRAAMEAELGEGLLAVAHGQAFVGIASAGFDSDANRIANEAPSWLGSLVYVYGALRALASWRPARFEIELDPPGRASRVHRLHRGAANSKTYGGGMRAAPDALLDDGLLEVVVLESVGQLRFLTKSLPKVFKGTHVQEPTVHVFRAREVESPPTAPSRCTPTATRSASCRCGCARCAARSRCSSPPA